MSIGIFQEIHARNLVQKLSIVAKENVHVVRNGVQQEIDTKELVMEDIVIISAGNKFLLIWKLLTVKSKRMKRC